MLFLDGRYNLNGNMERSKIVALWNKHGLDQAAGKYGISCSDLHLVPGYLGCQNIVYDYARDGQKLILRVSYRPDRSLEMIRAEVHFVNYLADHGVLVSRALPSLEGNLVETLQVAEFQFRIVSFEKARGMRVPDNQYRYREGVSIDEYCRDWGRILGQMHRLSRQYEPPESGIRRPFWLESWSKQHMTRIIPETLPVVRQKYLQLMAQLQALPQPEDAFGLIHCDFNDGNFCLDYDTGEITVFDFDDASYGWFMYELACAWEGFVGWAMFEPAIARRRELMHRYYAHILDGYCQENVLPGFWLEKLPFFLKVISLESLTGRLDYWQINQEPVTEDEQGEIDYWINCIEQDIPYLGLFDPVFNPEHPFCII